MTDERKNKHRIMDEFEIDEISAVTRPAQEHARMTIMKNNTTEKHVMKDFKELAEEIRKQRDCSATEAQRIARQRHPNAYAKYQHERDFSTNKRPIEKTTDTLAKRASFESEVDAMVSANRNLSRTAAMSKARREQPELFAAAFEE